MAKVKIKKQQLVDVEIEVNFPLYQSSYDATDGGGWRTYSRLDEDGTLWEVTHHEDFHGASERWEIEKSRWQDPQGCANGVDLTDVNSVSEEFENARSRAISFIAGA